MATHRVTRRSASDTFLCRHSSSTFTVSSVYRGYLTSASCTRRTLACMAQHATHLLQARPREFSATTKVAAQPIRLLVHEHHATPCRALEDGVQRAQRACPAQVHLDADVVHCELAVGAQFPKAVRAEQTSNKLTTFGVNLSHGQMMLRTGAHGAVRRTSTENASASAQEFGEWPQLMASAFTIDNLAHAKANARVEMRAILRE